MAKTIPLKKTKLNKELAQITDQFLNIVPPESFLTWHNYLFDDVPVSVKKLRYRYLETDILKLKKLFKERIILLNKIAQKEGYENYIKWQMGLEEIPQKEFDVFFNQDIDRFISLVMSEKIPIMKLMKREKDWNIFNTPYPLGNQWLQDRFDLPDEVLRLVSPYDKRLKKYRDKIDIKTNVKEFYSFSYLNKKKGVVEIGLRGGYSGTYQTLDFVHELGHALNQLEYYERGEDHYKLPKYQREENAIEFTHEFIKRNISSDHQKVLRYNELSTLAGILFEIDIFSNDKQDYDKAYAKAIERCFPMTKQKENPFYVLYKRFVVRPLGELTSSIVETELYLKDAKENSDT